MILTKTFKFEASHRLPFHQGKCQRLHGHSWILEVAVEGPVNDKTGMVLDFAEISKTLNTIVDDLDHRHLGTWEDICDSGILVNWSVPWLPQEFNATCENLVYEIAKQLSLDFPWHSLTLHETCTSGCTLTKGEFVRMNLKRGD